MRQIEDYYFNKNISLSAIRKAGFVVKDRIYMLRRTLYCYDGTRYPYVILDIIINDGDLTIDVHCDSGEIYIPFYNPDLQHHNSVYDTVVAKYDNIIDDLLTRKILKIKRKKHGKSIN
jgi:hypothetical protein